MDDTKNILIELTADEALILFNYLQREIDDKEAQRIKPSIIHDAELWALNNLNCALEKAVPDVAVHGYQQYVQKAQLSLVKHNGPWSGTERIARLKAKCRATGRLRRRRFISDSIRPAYFLRQLMGWTALSPSATIWMSQRRRRQ